MSCVARNTRREANRVWRLVMEAPPFHRPAWCRAVLGEQEFHDGWCGGYPNREIGLRTVVGRDGGTAFLASQFSQGVQLGVVGTREPSSVMTKLQTSVEGRQYLVISVRQFFPEIPAEPERHI